MPIQLPNGQPSLLIHRNAFERAGITRAAIDQHLALTDEEFRVEGDLIVIGPILDAGAMQQLTDDLEEAGLRFFDDYFDLSGSWPEWITLFARASARAPNDG